MRGLLRFMAAAIAASVALASCGATARADGGGSILEESPPLVIGRSVTLQSSVLGEERRLLIAVPDRYSEIDQPLPVIYLLDGWVHFRLVTATVEMLTRNARMPPTMVVAIANTDRSRDFTFARAEGLSTGGAASFLDFLETEVIPFVDGNFRTAPHRTLIGHSLGGLLAFNALAERPGLFDAAIAISPAVTNDQRGDRGQAKLSDRLTSVFESQDDLRFELYVTMSDGEDPAWISDLSTIEGVLEESAPEGLRWVLDEMRGEDHGTTVLPSVDRGLRFVNSDWNTSGLVREGNLEDLVGRFETLSERLGHPIHPPEVMVNLMGYRLLREGREGEAIAVFELNVELYPASANVHDSLGEALEQVGRLPGALRSYRRAVSIAQKTGDPLLPVFRGNLLRVEGLLARSSAVNRRAAPSPVPARPKTPSGPTRAP